jgi:hypothetical protein
MAFEWNFRELMRPRLADAYARRTYETLPEQPTNPMPTQMDPQGQGWLAAQQARNAQSMQGYIPNEAKQGYGQDYEDRSQSIAGEVGQDYYGNAGGDRGATAAQVTPNQIKDLQSQIEVIEKRIADNKAKLSNWTGNADKIAAIEARKINVNDPTSIWRWKEDRDNARRIANEQNKPNDTAKANALIEVANAVDNMIIDDRLDTPTANAMLSKLADYKTMLQKNGLPTSIVDEKIKKIKGEDNSEKNKGPENSEYSGRPKEQWDNEAKELMAKENLTQGDIMKFKQKNPILSDDVLLELNKKHNALIEKDMQIALNKRYEAARKLAGIDPSMWKLMSKAKRKEVLDKSGL